MFLYPSLTSQLDKTKLSPSLRSSTGEVLGHYFHFTREIGVTTPEVIFQVLKPGERINPPHYHTKLEEGIYLLKGSVTIWHPEREIKVNRGSYTAFPASSGILHMVYNDSENDAEVLLVQVPSDDDEVIYYDFDPWKERN